MFNVKQEVNGAYKRIRSYIRETMLEHSLRLSKATGVQIYLKCENLQRTGSFKARGAINKLLSLTPEERLKGVVTASTGNHGAAVAFGLNILGIKGTVFVPENASSTKIEAIRSFDVPVEFHGNDMMVTEAYAHDYAESHGMIYISPYNDFQVIAGQGTIGVELLYQLDKIDVVLVPVGGGGLISGIAGYIKACSPKTKIIGCLPENSPVMSESIKAGQMLEMKTKPTLSDGTGGGIRLDTITFELCRTLVDDYILVSEAEIADAIITLLKTHHLLIEGAAGVALAAVLKNTERFKDKNVVVVLSGANISVETLKSVLNKG